MKVSIDPKTTKENLFSLVFHSSKFNKFLNGIILDDDYYKISVACFYNMFCKKCVVLESVKHFVSSINRNINKNSMYATFVILNDQI